MFENILDLAPYIWLAILVLSAIVEASTVSLVSLWFMPSALICIILSLLSVPFYIQAIVFFIVSAVLLCFVMPVARRYMKKHIVKTNVEEITGCKGVVAEEINNLEARGIVTVNGQKWSARSENGETIPVGTVIEAVRVEGVKIVCKPENL